MQYLNGLIMFAPYPLIAWGFADLAYGVSFWAALGVLIAVRLAFAAVETLGEVLAWRLVGRRERIKQLVVYFEENRYPIRRQHVGFLLYLSRLIDELKVILYRLENGDDEALSRVEETRTLKSAVEDLQKEFEFSEQGGGLSYWRWRSAVEAAFEIYSPLALAPPSKRA